MHAYQALAGILTTARDFRDYIGQNVGPTDDWPCEICFDSEEEADKFLRLYEALDTALDAYEMLTS